MNLVALLAERAQRGEYGTDIAIVPSEAGVRIEVADPFNTTAYGGTKKNRAKMADGDLFTAYGLTTRDANARFDLRFQGYYYIHRIVFQPRPSVPEATMRDYWVRYGNAAHINNNRLSVYPFVIPPQVGQQIPVIKDISLDQPLLMGMVDILSRHPPGEYWEIAEVEIYGDGYPTDGFYASEIIDLGVNPPGVRRYAQQWDRYKLEDRTEVESQFPDQEGNSVTWGKVRWKARRLGEEGDVRIQFRAGKFLGYPYLPAASGEGCGRYAGRKRPYPRRVRLGESQLADAGARAQPTLQRVGCPTGGRWSQRLEFLVGVAPLRGWLG